MKKILCMLVCICLMLFVSACGNNSNFIQNDSNDSESVIKNDSSTSASVAKHEVAESKKNKKFEPGNKIVTDGFDVAINDISLTYEVLPDDTSGYYRYYEGDPGKIYIAIDADVYNKSKRSLSCDKIASVSANYNEGYEYKGFTAVEDSGGFTYANISSIDPLTTRGIKWIIQCPEEVKTSRYPLSVILTINGEKFEHIVR